MKLLLQFEEAALLLVAVLVFAHLPYAWWWLPALLLLPDLSMLGYLAGSRVGAACYNLLHHKALGLGMALLGWQLADPRWLLAASILLAHTALDRLLGYGLKYEEGFQVTHLGRIGQA